MLDIGVQNAQSSVTLVEGQALVCPRRPGMTFAQQIRNCTRAAGGPGGPRCECVDLNNAGQTALVKKSGGTNRGELDLDAGQFRLELRAATPRSVRAALTRPPRLRAAEAAFQPGPYAAGETPSFGAPRRLASRFDERRGACLLVERSFAACTVNIPGGQVQAVSGAYATSLRERSLLPRPPPASSPGRATGVVRAYQRDGEGFSSFSFSTAGDYTHGVQADSGGPVTLNATTSTAPEQ